MISEPLPAAVGILIILLSAASQAVAHRVPNVLTYPGILVGWLFAGYIDAMHYSVGPAHALPASLAGTVLTLLVMLPFYNLGLGAGCVKAQLAFAAWMFISVPLWPALAIVACATVGGVAVSYAWAFSCAADMCEHERCDYRFPAQVTMSLVATAGVVACWLAP